MQNSFTAQPMDIVKFYKSLNLLSFITFKSSVNLWWFTILQEYNKQLHHCTLYRVYFRTQQNIVNMHHAENSVKRETSFNKSRGSTWHSWNVIFCDKNCVCVCVCVFVSRWNTFLKDVKDSDLSHEFDIVGCKLILHHKLDSLWHKIHLKW